jgi:hypothetical protein
LQQFSNDDGASRFATSVSYPGDIGMLSGKPEDPAYLPLAQDDLVRPRMIVELDPNLVRSRRPPAHDLTDMNLEPFRDRGIAAHHHNRPVVSERGMRTDDEAQNGARNNGANLQAAMLFSVRERPVLTLQLHDRLDGASSR